MTTKPQRETARRDLALALELLQHACPLLGDTPRLAKRARKAYNQLESALIDAGIPQTADPRDRTRANLLRSLPNARDEALALVVKYFPGADAFRSATFAASDLAQRAATLSPLYDALTRADCNVPDNAASLGKWLRRRDASRWRCDLTTERRRRWPQKDWTVQHVGADLL